MRRRLSDAGCERFFEIAELAGNPSHQGETAGNQLRRQLRPALALGPVASLKSRGRETHPPFEEGAEAADAGKSHRHADLGDGILGQDQEVPGFLDLRARPALVRRLTEYRLVETDEMKPREPSFARDRRNRPGAFRQIAQRVPRPAKAVEEFPVQHALLLPAAQAPRNVLFSRLRTPAQKSAAELAALGCQRGGLAQTFSCGRAASGQSTWKNLPRGWSTRS